MSRRRARAYAEAVAAGARREDDGRAVRVEWADGAVARYHALWLRDSSLDATTRDRRNGQRLVTIDAIAADVRVAGAEVRTGEGGAALVVDFSDGVRGAAYPLEWLRARRYDGSSGASAASGASGATAWVGRDARPWRAADLAGRVCVASLDALRRDDAVRARWLGAMVRDGVARVTGMPRESGAVCDVVATWGYVRETNYGRWFDVKATVDPANLADTNLGLQAHTDNPYRDPVPTVQVLACLENDVEGGVSTVVDGWAVAADLAARDPEAFALLATRPARWEWAGDGRTVLRAKRPIIELGPDGEILTVRWNSRSIAPIVDVAYDEMPRWYAAYRTMSAMVDDPAYAVSFRLEPGEAFVVDNTRVLHARTAFSGGGTRWLQGCYSDMDGVRSAREVLVRRGVVDGRDADAVGVDAVAEVEAIFAAHGDGEYLGEAVTMSAHMLQAAALAMADGAPDHLVAAALLHDVGHFTGVHGAYAPTDTRDRHHDEAGRDWLAARFAPEVAECVGLHVAAKRWLCAAEPDYLAALSPASRHTLELQGGPMSAAERRDFEARPAWRDAVRVRRWDDGAKVPGVVTPRLEDLRPLLRRVARG